jgi:hypothetical protein
MLHFHTQHHGAHNFVDRWGRFHYKRYCYLRHSLLISLAFASEALKIKQNTGKDVEEEIWKDCSGTEGKPGAASALEKHVCMGRFASNIIHGRDGKRKFAGKTYGKRAEELQ